VLLSIAYLPPISYFALMAKEFTLSPDGVIPSTVYLEACENYQKQSWRNRFTFLAADGPQSLNFPIVHEPGVHNLPITSVKVDYSVPWVLKTERAIESAYESSAFFDYYKDDFFAILDSKPETLFDLDLQLIRFFLHKTGISTDILLTNEYSPVLSRSEVLKSEFYGSDYREILHPKRPDTVLRSLDLEKPYFQVFSRKHGFVPNLSIIDLLSTKVLIQLSISKGSRTSSPKSM
jgi:WbqC-like protein family.